MTYQDQVQAAAGALVRGDDANWELARLTYENTLQRGDTDQEGRVQMAEWCADVRAASGRRFGITTGQHYRRMWAEYGPLNTTDRPTWAEAVGDKYPSQTYDAVRERLAVAEVRHGTPESKAQLFTELAADPEVQAAAVEHGPIRSAVARLSAASQAADAERAQATDAVTQQLTERSALLDLDHTIRRFTQDIAEILPHLERIPAADRDPMANLYFLRRSLAALHEATRAVEAFVLQGQAEPDALITVLQGGRNG